MLHRLSSVVHLRSEEEDTWPAVFVSARRVRVERRHTMTETRGDAP